MKIRMKFDNINEKNKLEKRKMYKTMDLFAGAGGLSYGFEMTNKFQIVAAAEKMKMQEKHIRVIIRKKTK